MAAVRLTSSGSGEFWLLKHPHWPGLSRTRLSAPRAIMFLRAALCSSSCSVCVSVNVMSTKSKVAPTRNRPAANEDPRATGVSEPRASSSGALEPEGQPYAEAVSTDEDNIAQAQAKTGVSKPSASLSGAIEPDFVEPHAEVSLTASASINADNYDSTQTTRLLTFDLRWPSGTLIKRFEVFDLSVERFTQDMDEGLIAGTPRAATDIAGNWLESYNIAWDAQVLQDGQRLSDYDIPQGATLTVLLQTQTAGSFV